MTTFSPEFLPWISSIEVILLKDVEANRVSEFIREAKDAPRVVIGGDEANEIASLWRGLPPGEQSRCHFPPYGVRFRQGNRVVCEASICWECDNIFGYAGDNRVHYEFNSAHPTSQALLSNLRRAVDGRKSG